MDLLSDVLQTLRLSGAIFLRADFTAPMGVSPKAWRLQQAAPRSAEPSA